MFFVTCSYIIIINEIQYISVESRLTEFSFFVLLRSSLFSIILAIQYNTNYSIILTIQHNTNYSIILTTV